MATLTVTVDWPAGTASPKVDQDEVEVREKNTKVRWVPGENVASVDDITGLPDSEFNSQGPVGKGRYQVNDKKDNNGRWKYTVHATNDQNEEGLEDPKIRNRD